MNECSLKRDHFQKEISSSNHQFSADMSVSSRVIGQNNPIFQPIIPGWQISAETFSPPSNTQPRSACGLLVADLQSLVFGAGNLGIPQSGLVTEPWGVQCLSRPCVGWKSPTRNCCWEWGCFKSLGPWHMVHLDFSFWDWKDIPSSHTPLVRMESDNDSKHIPENHHSLHPFHSFPYLPLSPKPKQRPQKNSGPKVPKGLHIWQQSEQPNPTSHGSRVKSCPKIQVYPYDSYMLKLKRIIYIPTFPPQKNKTCCIN